MSINDKLEKIARILEEKESIKNSTEDGVITYQQNPLERICDILEGKLGDANKNQEYPKDYLERIADFLEAYEEPTVIPESNSVLRYSIDLSGYDMSVSFLFPTTMRVVHSTSTGKDTMYSEKVITASPDQVYEGETKLLNTSPIMVRVTSTNLEGKLQVTCSQSGSSTALTFNSAMIGDYLFFAARTLTLSNKVYNLSIKYIV